MGELLEDVVTARHQARAGDAAGGVELEIDENLRARQVEHLTLPEVLSRRGWHADGPGEEGE